MDPKLIAARAEITEIIKRHDIAAHVVLHNAAPGGGNTETWLELSPSYSKLAVVPLKDGIAFHLRSKAEDYGGDLDAQRRDLASTANMVSTMAMLLGTAAMPMLEMSARIDKEVGAEHTPMGSAE